MTVTQSYFSKNNLDQYNTVNFKIEIRRAPGAGQEISRILNALPSVASVGENRQDMLVFCGPSEMVLLLITFIFQVFHISIILMDVLMVQ